jgi:hypothetical protein
MAHIIGNYLRKSAEIVVNADNEKLQEMKDQAAAAAYGWRDAILILNLVGATVSSRGRAAWTRAHMVTGYVYTGIIDFQGSHELITNVSDRARAAALTGMNELATVTAPIAAGVIGGAEGACKAVVDARVTTGDVFDRMFDSPGGREVIRVSNGACAARAAAWTVTVDSRVRSCVARQPATVAGRQRAS